jgi:nucleotide-binding universal stress UspA family protein
VRVVQGGRRDCLALETLSRRRIDLATKNLDRDWPVEPCIAGAIHLPGAPFADQGFDAVGSYVGPGRDGRSGLRAGLYASRRKASITTSAAGIEASRAREMTSSGVGEGSAPVVEFTHILCPVDLSESSAHSLVHAAALARWYGAALTVLHVVPTFDPVEVRGDLGVPIQIVNPMPRGRVLEEMHRVVALAVGSTKASLSAESGDARTVIVDQALTIKADLIVMGTHGHRGFKRLVVGSVTESVLREAPCPVLTVPPHERPATSQAVTFKRILCPVDFSPSSLQGVGFALDLVRQADGRVTLLSVLEWLAEEEPRSLAHFNVPEFRSHMARDTEDQLRALVADEPQTRSAIDTLVVFGRAHRQILRVAEEQSADLIVMGAQGRGGMSLALFGSTTQQVVRGATCPVLTVRGLRQR